MTFSEFIHAIESAKYVAVFVRVQPNSMNGIYADITKPEARRFAESTYHTARRMSDEALKNLRYNARIDGGGLFIN